MEPRPFARLSVSAIALRFTPEAPILSSSSPSPSPALSPSLQCSYSCTINLSHFEAQTAPLPVFSPASKAEPDSTQVAASFYLDEPLVTKFRSCSRFFKKPHLRVTVHENSPLACSRFASCWAPSAARMQTRRKCIGEVTLPVGAELASSKAGLHLHQGWITMGQYKSAKVEFHMNAKVDLDPRYIFQFDGEPELSPQIVHIQGNIRQPIFSCKFTRDRSFRSRADVLNGGHAGASDWEMANRIARGDRDKKGRKGWLLLIYDLSGSPVAAASMVTPFVPTAGCDRVSRANPGAWLIMKAGPMGEDSWRPWGRLEAWREKGTKGGLGCRFQLMAEGGGMAGFNNYGVLMSETVINSQKGGNFFIDTAKFKPETPTSASPVDSPQSSGDFYFSLGNPAMDCGFVMSANVQGEGKTANPPHVQLAMRYVSCVEDAAVFMALAAAVDLSMDACLPFTKKLGKSFDEQP